MSSDKMERCMGLIPKTTGNNLLVVMTPLFMAEGLMCYPVFVNHYSLWHLLIPISLLTLVPKAFLFSAWEAPSYVSCGWTLALIAFDLAFLWFMGFAVARNYRLIGSISLLLFVILSLIVIA